MKCKNCGFDNLADNKFCGMCGARLAQICARCGFENPLEYHFCCMCGAPLSDPSTNGGSQSVSSDDLSDHRPVETGNGSQPESRPISVIEGERRIATVIMADVRNSTLMMEKIGTEAWVDTMNRVFQILEAEIYRFGGQVDQFRGDGLVAFFGARAADEDDPEHAVLAGLSMQQSIKVLAANLAEENGIDLKLRVGINTGEVILTSVGDVRQHKEDTAMGEAIAIAARMETSAEPGTVLVSENTYQLVKARFKWQALGEIAVKGVSKPLAVYRPLDLQLEGERILDPQTYSAPTLLSGRSTEIQTLKDIIHNLVDGRGGIVTVTGEKGMGKTYVVNQVRQYFARQGKLVVDLNDEVIASFPENGSNPTGAVIWLVGRCRSYDQSWPYSLWLDLIQRWLGIRLDEAIEEARARLKAHVERLWGTNMDSYYPYLATLLSLPLEETYADRIRHLDAQTLKHQVFSAVRNWIEILADQLPLV